MFGKGLLSTVPFWKVIVSPLYTQDHHLLPLELLHINPSYMCTLTCSWCKMILMELMTSFSTINLFNKIFIFVYWLFLYLFNNVYQNPPLALSAHCTFLHHPRSLLAHYHISISEFQISTGFNRLLKITHKFKGTVHPKMKILSLIAHPHVVPNPRKTFIHLHKLRYFWWNPRAFWPSIDSKGTTMVKAQNRSKNIVKTVHVTSVAQHELFLFFAQKNYSFPFQFVYCFT